MRSPSEAVAWGREQVDHPVKDFTRLCLQFVRMAYGLPVVHPDAGTAWDLAELRHPTRTANSIPRGVPVFFELPSVADHVALSLGDGWCLSNDVLRTGRIDRVRIDAIVQRWGAQLLGWTEDLNGHRVFTAPTKVAPSTPTRVALARHDTHAAIRRLNEALAEGDRGKAVLDFRNRLRYAVRNAPKR